MCNKAAETTNHLFFECEFAARVWGWLLDFFQAQIAFGPDLCSFIRKMVDQHMSTQLKDVWLADIVAVIWGIWI